MPCRYMDVFDLVLNLRCLDCSESPQCAKIQPALSFSRIESEIFTDPPPIVSVLERSRSVDCESTPDHARVHYSLRQDYMICVFVFHIFCVFCGGGGGIKCFLARIYTTCTSSIKTECFLKKHRMQAGNIIIIFV